MAGRDDVDVKKLDKLMAAKDAAQAKLDAAIREVGAADKKCEAAYKRMRQDDGTNERANQEFSKAQKELADAVTLVQKAQDALEKAIANLRNAL